MCEKFASFHPEFKRGDLPDVLIREALQTDIPKLASLASRRNQCKLELSLKSFQKLFDKPLEQDLFPVLVAEVDGQFAGYARQKKMKFPGGEVPDGWYLMGVVVEIEFRGRGIGHALTRKRIENIFEVAEQCYYFVNSRNLVSKKLHDSLGFELIAKDIKVPHVTFTNGSGELYLLKKSSDQR